jgi:hypothetical protein
MSDGGKGDKPRPIGIPMEEFDNRWDTIFKQPDTSKIAEKVVQQVKENLQNDPFGPPPHGGMTTQQAEDLGS